MTRGHDRPRVLLVEDNEVDRLVATAFLTRLGAEVDVATDGDQALAMLGATGYDAVFLDCRLPGRDGFEVIAQLRRWEQEGAGVGRRVPVIALSAAGDSDAERCRAAGMDDVLTKPVTLADLEAALESWGGGGAGRAAPDPAAAGEAGPGPAPAAPHRPLDPARLAELRDPDPEGYDQLIADLARSFVPRATAMLARLAEAVRRGDATATEQDAHALKGSAGNLGAARLARLAGDLESLGRHGELAGAAEVLRAMTDEFGHVRRELAALVPGV